MNNLNRFPDFIIGGAPKSGTSSLYFWLAAHPALTGSKVKETFFFGGKVNRFNSHANYLEHSLDRYAEYFSHCPADQLAFEATAAYLYSENAVKGFQELPEVPKVIFSLRHPAQQMYSHYKMERYRIHNVDEELAAYVNRENVEHMWRYSRSIPMWLQNYPRDKVKFILFEDLMTNKVERMKEIAEFLEIDPTFYTTHNFEHRNESVATKSKWLHRFGLKVQPLIPHALQRMLLPMYMKVNAGSIPGKSDADRKVLQNMYSSFDEEINKVKALLPHLPVDKYWKAPSKSQKAKE